MLHWLRRKSCVATIAIALLCTAQARAADSSEYTIAGVYFYGCDGSHVDEIKKAMPPLIGEKHTDDDRKSLQSKISQVVWKTTWCFPTQIAVVNSGNSKWNIYIGLKGRSVDQTSYKPASTGDVKLPEEVVAIGKEMDDYSPILLKEKGGTSQDLSKGYALDNDPVGRALQLKLRNWVFANQQITFDVLKNSSNANERALAAEALGYLDPSKEQIDALIDATRDGNSGVRNNAARALGCIASSTADLASQIPSERFVEMLNSGVWSDRNKGEFVLAKLCQHDPALIARVQDKAIQALSDMAAWDTPHAYSARTLLADIAKIPDANREQLLNSDNVGELIKAAMRYVTPVDNSVLAPSEPDLHVILKKVFLADQSDKIHSSAKSGYDQLLKQQDKFVRTNVAADYWHSLSFEAFHVGQSAALENDSKTALLYLSNSLNDSRKSAIAWEADNSPSMQKGEQEWSNYVEATLAYMNNDRNKLEELKDKGGSNNRFIVKLLTGLQQFDKPDYLRDYGGKVKNRPSS